MEEYEEYNVGIVVIYDASTFASELFDVWRFQVDLLAERVTSAIKQAIKIAREFEHLNLLGYKGKPQVYAVEYVTLSYKRFASEEYPRLGAPVLLQTIDKIKLDQLLAYEKISIPFGVFLIDGDSKPS